jgi:putative ABC transport system ATP-binding protein
MSGPGQVVASRVTRRFATPHGHIDALVEVDLTLEPGATIGVFGPSGCGKSTLLALIGGLDLPTSGTVSVGGVDLAAMDRRRRAHVRQTQYGFVFQSDGLMPFLTAEENVALQMSLGGTGLSEPIDLLDRLGLAPEAHRLPDQLSGGQRQRIAVATAVAHMPKVIIADEPTGSLDSANAAAVVDLLLEARSLIDGTLIVASHDPTVCDRMSRTILLREGRVVGDVESIPSSGED